MFMTPRSQLRGKQTSVENVADVIRLEATEMGPPQTFVWFTGLEAAELAAPEAEYEAEAVIPSTFFPF